MSKNQQIHCYIRVLMASIFCRSLLKFDYTRTTLAVVNAIVWLCIVLVFSIILLQFLTRQAFTKVRGILLVLIFLIIDQVIKALLYFAPSEISIPVIPNILSILVILNKYQTLVLQAADKFASPYIVACAKLLLLPVFLLLLYLLSKSKNRFNFKTPIGYAGVTLISSAILSTVLDSLIYKGTPDYFYLIPLYSSVDLKDVFAFLGAVAFVNHINKREKYAEENNEHGGKMIYQQDWLMRQIEAMIQAILAVALGISANEQTATQIEDSSYGKMLEKMIDDGDICAAEDLLFNDLDQSDLSWLQIALDFYSKLNNCSDDYLAMHDFSREEIDQGLRYICTLFGYDFLVSN